MPTPFEPGYFVCKLLPPRASFARDMTPSERAAMDADVQYWTARVVQGVVLLFGPVRVVSPIAEG